MELVQKTFLERLRYVQGELRAIAQCAELRQLIQDGHYHPGLTILDALHAVTEVVDTYYQNQEFDIYFEENENRIAQNPL